MTEINTVEQWLNNNKLGCDIWHKKYQYDNENFQSWLERVSHGNKELKQLILDKKFLFGGRALSNRDTDGKSSYFNCYSSGYCPDDFKGILELNSNLGLTYKAQGGQGVSLSKLRPKGTSIGGRYASDGIIPFLELFNKTTEITTQGGSRKGALLVSLDMRHKESEEFITIKTTDKSINKANLSLEIDDEFMNVVKEYYISGKEIILHEKRKYSGHIIEYDIIPIKLYKLMMKTVYDWAEPGCLFTNRFRNYNLMELDDDYQIETCNPLTL
jgi:ribonucleoside-diphosphate reductase alpha chain